MASSYNGEDENPDYSETNDDGSLRVKVICLGDSAVGKSKLVERFLLDGYVSIDFWDTAGQERFSSMHPSYYHQAHACILVFDITRKITYKNLPNWFKELKEYRPEIPVFCAANKIDADPVVTRKTFNFPKKFAIPLYFVSASDGTNVVKLFTDAINSAVQYKLNPSDFVDEILKELDNLDDEEKPGEEF